GQGDGHVTARGVDRDHSIRVDDGVVAGYGVDVVVYCASGSTARAQCNIRLVHDLPPHAVARAKGEGIGRVPVAPRRCNRSDDRVPTINKARTGITLGTGVFYVHRAHVVI